MSASPNYTAIPATAAVLLGTANPNRDGTGTIVDAYIFRSSTNGGTGGRIDSVRCPATVTTTAGMIRVYRKSVAGAYRLMREIAVTPVTPSATVKAYTIPTTEGADINGDLIINEPFLAGEGIAFSTEKAEAFHGSVKGGEF